MGAEDPAKKGVCSNFLCDSQPGQELKLTGPSGKVMLIPEKDPSVDLIMVATGTGIAPYRSFLRRLFVEKTPFGEAYTGLAWLFLGVEYTDDIFTRMDNGAHMYFCGLKGMMPGITEMLETVSKDKGLVWEDKLKEWKKAGQWHVEVY